LYLFFDTETTGLPQSWDAPVEDLDNWPRLVQIAWLVYDEQGIEIEKVSKIIMPEGFTIPSEASDIHGISTDRAYDEGDYLIDVLESFMNSLENCRYLIAHNIAFDEKIIMAELLRKNISNNIQNIEKICTMLSTVNLCKLPSHYGYKWPKLMELHKVLFGVEFDDAHDALADIEACAKCFLKLREIHYL
jgi:DNA polymerase III epsilon subunit-like protein